MPKPPRDDLAELAEAYEARSNLQAILLDTSDPAALGGTGRRASVGVAQAIAERVPVVLAGGLNAANVAEALLEVPAIGVDVSSGVEPEPRPEGRPSKDPLAVALFVKRADRGPPRPAHRALRSPPGRSRACSKPTRPAAGASSARSVVASCPRR